MSTRRLCLRSLSRSALHQRTAELSVPSFLSNWLFDAPVLAQVVGIVARVTVPNEEL